MTDMAWQKTGAHPGVASRSSERIKFLIGGLLIIAAVVYLIVSGTMSGAQYFLTVDQIVADSSYVGKAVRISGAVVGDSIQYDSRNLILDFTIANIPAETTDLALTLHNAVNDPQASRLTVHVENQVKPDLLQHEAQAILTGTLGADGTFYATELLLKCPSRYEEAVPGQSETTG
ncbi:MAG: cytochrome c maturation protein CcmE [Anaerolineae bacterium]|nr:cytochrome c maturation protein CcmE [Anaerolineae bacterium]